MVHDLGASVAGPAHEWMTSGHQSLRSRWEQPAGGRRAGLPGGLVGHLAGGSLIAYRPSPGRPFAALLAFAARLASTFATRGR
jgi:hypothetical protein